MTEAEIIIAKMVVDDSNIPKSCNEYKIIIEALEKQINAEEHDKQIRADAIQDIRVEIANRVPSRPITKRAIEVWEDKYWLLIHLDKKLEQMQKGAE